MHFISLRSPNADEIMKFHARYTKSDGCWTWRGCLHSSGYGSFYMGRQKVSAHRLAFVIHNGEIPDGLVIDHLCRNRSCVNPEHLEAVTQSRNVRRGLLCADTIRLGSNCSKGHLIDEESIMRTKRGPRCRICNRNYMREYMRNRRVAAQSNI